MSPSNRLLSLLKYDGSRKSVLSERADVSDVLMISDASVVGERADVSDELISDISDELVYVFFW